VDVVTKSSVLVVGGGPAGLAAAIALRHSGHDVDVIERHAPDRAQGSELLLPVMVHPVLHSLGVLDACLTAGVPGRELLISMAPGTPPVVIPLPGTESVPAGTPTGIGIQRPVLHQILWEAAARAGATLTSDIALADVSAGDDKVTVRLSDGSETAYDLLVGADGMFSDTRSAVFPEIAPPPRTGQAVWRARIARDAGSLPQLLGIFYGPERRKVGIIDVTGDSQYIFMAEPAVPEGVRLDPARLTTEFRRRLAGFDGHVARARDLLTDATSTSYTQLHRILVATPWYRGRVVLIGDAAHGVTPHISYGAGLSIEDGSVLAGSLRSAGSLTAGLAAFVERRFQRCRDAVRACELLGESELNPGQTEIDPMQVTGEAWHKLGQSA
jgi:2-polyprenyl-6-methoxyphenol hydroxylase-like FAD-dependent oxidoreductase